ncbi:MAG: hypothetical protein ACYC7E_16325 [Armatimonadota bacterium]
MHLCRHYRWHLFLVITLLGVTMVPATARPEREGTLNGITVSSSFMDVLVQKGPPHWIGPALEGPDAVLDILDPPPMPLDGIGASTPGAPMPGSGMGPMPPGGMGPGGMITLKPKAKNEYIVWLYEGPGRTPNPDAGWNTYVLFNKTGQVAGVVVAVMKPGVLPQVKTRSGVTFGTKMIDIISEDKFAYGWPQPFVRVASHYFLSYPDYNVTYSLDSSTRRVVVIAIGISLTVNPLAQTTQGTGPGGPMMPPGGLPR